MSSPPETLRGSQVFRAGARRRNTGLPLCADARLETSDSSHETGRVEQLLDRPALTTVELTTVAHGWQISQTPKARAFGALFPVPEQISPLSAAMRTSGMWMPRVRPLSATGHPFPKHARSWFKEAFGPIGFRCDSSQGPTPVRIASTYADSHQILLVRMHCDLPYPLNSWEVFHHDSTETQTQRALARRTRPR